MKLYKSDFNDEIYLPISQILQEMADMDISQTTITLGKRDPDTSYFFCKEFQMVGETNDTCGRTCGKYEPKNGKNGVCRHYGYCYEDTYIQYILFDTGKKKRI